MFIRIQEQSSDQNESHAKGKELQERKRANQARMDGEDSAAFSGIFPA